ncbi:hypothetical protein [Maridesulfovibrio bastinii]|uniref:capsular polysaccharide export protein, LipB/KpsS family n=1 Tax=Maridesulfovibrio bastinii TaxID=47157 RepID=UPI00041E83B8|nr:hypothetical protein [Maridesulfovibrio bastinii]
MDVKRILIINPLANYHRAPIFCGLAKTLQAADHEVFIIYEQKVCILIGESINFWNSKNSFLYRDVLPDDHIFELDSQPHDSAQASQEMILKQDESRTREFTKVIDKIKPDSVIMFNGNFHYQNVYKNVLEDKKLLTKTLFMEVAWFTQRDAVYFDTNGVNRNSSLVNLRPLALCTAKQTRLDAWRERYLERMIGKFDFIPKRIVVPLQVDTDTNIRQFSPFSSMREFINFLEKWIPEGYEVILKIHPKALYTYPLTTSRPDFHLCGDGNIYDYIARAEYVIGINSTVLLESVVLGKKVLAFGGGVYSGNGVIHEADPLSPFLDNFKADQASIDAFIYELVFNRQVSIDALVSGNAAHLFSRTPFNDWEIPKKIRPQLTALNAKEGKAMIKVGKSKISKTASLDVTGEGKIFIGDNCEVRHHAVLEVIGRYNGTITIGDNSVIGICNWLQGSGDIIIGNDVIIGPYTCIVSTNHTYNDPATPVAKLPLTRDSVVIEDDVWVGAHVTIACGVTIGAHSIIGANSFVNKDVPPYSIVAGSPAKVIKRRK